MKNAIQRKKIFFALRTFILNLAYSLGWIFGLNKSTLSILCFHSISNNTDRYSISLDTFSKIIDKIKKNSNFISISDVFNILKGKEIKKPAVTLTFDDGYEDVLQILPLTKKNNIPVAIFVLSNPQKADRQELGHNGNLLDWKQLRYLKSQGWTIGCHGATHADFSTLSTPQLKKEIIDSKKEMEKQLGTKVLYFAYPKGICNEEIMQLAKEAGYKAAFAVSPNCVDKTQSPWCLPRVVIDATHSIAEIPAVYFQTTMFIRRLITPLRIWNIFLSA